MIYLDSSVALAHLLVEDRVPPAALWGEPLVSSRLLEYELWTRIHARRLGLSHGDMVRALLGRVALLEFAAPVLARALGADQSLCGVLTYAVRISSWCGSAVTSVSLKRRVS